MNLNDLREFFSTLGYAIIPGKAGAICLDIHRDNVNANRHSFPWRDEDVVWTHARGGVYSEEGLELTALIPVGEVSPKPTGLKCAGGWCFGPDSARPCDGCYKVFHWNNAIYNMAGFGWPVGNLGVEGNPGRPFAYPGWISQTPSGRFYKVTQTISLDI